MLLFVQLFHAITRTVILMLFNEGTADIRAYVDILYNVTTTTFCSHVCTSTSPFLAMRERETSFLKFSPPCPILVRSCLVFYTWIVSMYTGITSCVNTPVGRLIGEMGGKGRHPPFLKPFPFLHLSHQWLFNMWIPTSKPSHRMPSLHPIMDQLNQ